MAGMNSCEIVKASLEFAAPPRIVYGMGGGFPSDFRHVGRDRAPNSRFVDWHRVGDRWEMTDEWGNTWRRLEQATKGEPKVGVLEESWDLLDGYEFPRSGDRALYERAAAAAGQIHSEGRYVVASINYPFNAARYLRRFDQFLMDVLLEPERVKQLLARLTDMCVAEVERFADAGADAVFGAEDWGTQDRLLVSPELWREMFKPYFKTICEAAHARGVRVFLHSCGRNTDVIADWVEVGMDVLQYDQPELHGIDHLSRNFGGRIHFWCPVDIQKSLQTRDPERIEAAAREYVEKLGTFGGGFIAGYYGSNEALGIDPELQAVACRAFMKHGEGAPGRGKPRRK
jgi:uroporphyrinogen decarboxylase